MIGAGDEDMKSLIDSGFLIPFPSGVIAVRHWKVNNQLRGDRYKPTVYTEEKATMTENGNGEYITECVYMTTVNQPSTNCQPNDNQTETQYSIDEYSIDKHSIVSSPPTGSDVYAERFAEFWKAYPKKVGKEAARKAFKKIKPTADLLQRMLEAIKEQKASDQWKRDNGQYIPNPATWLNQGRWEDEATETTTAKNDISLEEFFNG